MPAWGWFLVAVAVGSALLAVAIAVDVRARRSASGAGQPAPRRGIEAVDAQVPHYVTQDDIDALPNPGRDRPREPGHPGEGFSFGHEHGDFGTNPSGATLSNPRILVVDGVISSMRELLGPLSAATEALPLVVVAEGFHPEVITTLAANRRALTLPVVAAAAGGRDRTRLAELTGAAALSPADLRAGYVPSSALGSARRWTSTPARAWVQP